MIRREAIRRLGVAAVVAATGFALSGCVYLRLLRFMHQIKAFDDYIAVAMDDGLALELRKPLLLDTDFVYVTDSEATSIRRTQEDPLVEIWTWVFEKETDDGSDAFELDFRMRFEERLLTKLDFDDRLVAAIPGEFLVEMFRSLGDAKISKFRRIAKAEVRSEEIPNVEVPTLAEIAGIMGGPTKLHRSGKESLRAEYVFNFMNPKSGAVAGQFRVIFASGQGADDEITSFTLIAKGK